MTRILVLLGTIVTFFYSVSVCVKTRAFSAVPITMLTSALLQFHEITINPEDLFAIAECSDEVRLPRRVRPDTIPEKIQTGLKGGAATFGILSALALKGKNPKAATALSVVSIGLLGASETVKERCGNFTTPTHG
jgi:hypothetical protein